MKKKLVLAMAIVMGVLCLTGCKTKKQEDVTSEVTPTQETVKEEEKVSEEPVKEKEEVTVEPETTKKSDAAILVVSFGTSYNDSRDLTIGGIENAIIEAFPELEVRRAFTSQIIIDKLKERDNLIIDNVKEALDRAVADGIKQLYVQPTHLMNGFEYDDLAAELTDYLTKFDKIIIGEPLLTSDDDFNAVIQAITKKTASFDDGQTAICFMGHGTEADSNAVYAKMQDMITSQGFENYYIGTVEAAPTVEDLITAIDNKGTYKKVVLEDLMVVAGDHANNDMAGDEEDSWKSKFQSAGYEVECILEGLGQVPEIQQLYVDHIKTAINEDKAFAGVKKVETGDANQILPDGTYDIVVDSDSSMFKIVKSQLTVKDGAMSAILTLNGTGYGKLFMGTATAAADANESEFIPFVEDKDGAYTYEIPVAAFEELTPCAAYSIKKEKWYDRILIIHAPIVPSKEQLADGTYTVDLTFEGGSGRAKIESPATITISGEKMVATVTWNSENYDYMLVDGEKYLPVNTEGNSVFEIPVSALDTGLNVIGDTVAMSTPKEIEYIITFHSETMKKAE